MAHGEILLLSDMCAVPLLTMQNVLCIRVKVINVWLQLTILYTTDIDRTYWHSCTETLYFRPQQQLQVKTRNRIIPYTPPFSPVSWWGEKLLESSTEDVLRTWTIQLRMWCNYWRFWRSKCVRIQRGQNYCRPMMFDEEWIVKSKPVGYALPWNIPSKPRLRRAGSDNSDGRRHPCQKRHQ